MELGRFLTIVLGKELACSRRLWRDGVEGPVVVEERVLRVTGWSYVWDRHESIALEPRSTRKETKNEV